VQAQVRGTLAVVGCSARPQSAVTAKKTYLQRPASGEQNFAAGIVSVCVYRVPRRVWTASRGIAVILRKHEMEIVVLPYPTRTGMKVATMSLAEMWCRHADVIKKQMTATAADGHQVLTK
jgi:hypothetical protein